MKRINLAKFGFRRSERDDFSDDGTRFTCYCVGNKIRVSKATWNGTVFISARLEDGTLSYDEYSKLPHYKDLDALNGVSIEQLTEQDLINLYNNCIEYEKEYTEKMQDIVYPTRTEYINYLKSVKQIRQNEFNDAIKVLNTCSTDFILYADSWEVSSIKDYIKRLQQNAVSPIQVPDDITTLNSYQREDYNQQKDFKPSYCYLSFIEKIKNFKQKCLQINKIVL